MSRRFITENAHYISFTIALVAMLGSLYFSEILRYQACTYCWYSRILMYPLVVILGIAAVRKDVKQSIYVMTLSALGFGMASYHYATQKLPAFSDATLNVCGEVPCTTQYINWLGFITIPFLALLAFLLIFIMQFLLWRVTK